ncbi:type II toxin-antitoxin system RelE/ParE family toxin [uncultured Polaribacter sp.]|uniref:type II toxin-antitoxin system RelE/ParE family toxin n=1 Tax=uncultured Polaribacter sp. TaxID=174711 RepID=UPI00262733B3|nr:type II toxin-antitoxin system RelE/ParE family toxin [uncultured Polaribacter sp.]
MTKTIVWSKRATNDLEKVTKFNLKLYNSKKAIEISKKLIASKLIASPEILLNSKIDLTNHGQIDESFKHLKRIYRRILINQYKITYRIGKNDIYIVRVFDTRQHPNKNK